MLRLFRILFLIFVVVSLSAPVLAASEENIGSCIISNSDQLKNMSWNFLPIDKAPGKGLLMGAKELMKGIYTLRPGTPDYLPTSYTNQNNGSTQYVIHSVNPTQVKWPISKKAFLQWTSTPGGTPKGWSGKIIFAGPVISQYNQTIYCATDCSGFITSLFTYANTKIASNFTGWKKGSMIPEAGCWDPYGNCSHPNPLNYYHLFTSGDNGWFQRVSLDQLAPGDMIAYANTKNQNDTGHIMLVGAVSICPADKNTTYVVVFDETGSVHSFDTRPVQKISPKVKINTGLGMGVIKLVKAENQTIKFYWGLNSPTPEVGAVALGRAR